ncbi:MAG: 50S ribosomal protein L23 [Methanomassiliicoccaceae archaeon]|jgi:large subunit ribosomal protein L23|nr:50S ribosomal protein L23 [Euryarchaeota archaeon]HOB38327.1 50S ribosomal protein L23 [Methanomassiliicoccaceae archaeon]HQA20462.1 50S ribosomal protein L23 [Methanomassiliicoccaceae archaeon]HQD87508.1 50S ribosomal protein L23 [Methanomassiliicoccaceae archaeon]
MAKDNILLHPYVTEKTMNSMTGTPTQDFKDGNRIEFVVLKSATKQQIKEAFEAHFDVKVEKVWTKVTKKGKRATILLAEGYSAEDIGMRIGVF